MAQQKWVYTFGDGKAEGSAKDRALLGGKGANLAEMCALGLPVPPGFTITTEACQAYYANNKQHPDDLKQQVDNAFITISKQLTDKFGDNAFPILVSVRSGAKVSMPGMMDTILNLGLNDETVELLAKISDDARFAYDSYRRLIQMFGDVVLEIDHHHFETALQHHKDANGYASDTDLSADDWRLMVKEFKSIIKSKSGKDFPQDVNEQLWSAINAVFNSWMNDRAKTYRRLYSIPDSLGTAVNIQAMVFGNMGNDCATGVAFTRNPSTGENRLYGEYLINAQGEDVVAGIRTPQEITRAGKAAINSPLPCMEDEMPDIYKELLQYRETLEQHYKDMQDIEFTVQSGKLWLLQTRNGKRTAQAAVKTAVEMHQEELIDKETAIMRVDPNTLNQLLHSQIDESAPKELLGKGLPASPGAASGVLVFTADEADEKASDGINVILARTETSPEDIHGMYAAKGILTTRGGMTSHAAVVARGMGCTCVAGANSLVIDEKAGTLTAENGRVIKSGAMITLDGTSGSVYAGEVPTQPPSTAGEFGTFMQWADDIRELGIYVNAETPEDIKTALDFGAEGIGLARTEHMFFAPERIMHVREMIMAETPEARRQALIPIGKYQKQDFLEIFNLLDGKTATIRLLDPPLHEFLPHSHQEIQETAKALNLGMDQTKTVEYIKSRIGALEESNPMLGHRGCRLGITYPQIYEVQVRAMLEAAAEYEKTSGKPTDLDIMVPLVASVREIDFCKKHIDQVAAEITEKTGIKPKYKIGTMIELPRAALRADSIAKRAEFFSFGTNDLTQTTWGLSRDDAGMFLPKYQEMGVLDTDPFVTLDQTGVGELIEIAVERGRERRPDIKIGICGEHGGDPASIEFCQQTGLDYVSCSPYRVPIARLAAAQAVLKKITPEEKAKLREVAA